MAAFNLIPKETVFIHFNDALLLSGEYLYYSFFCLESQNLTPSPVSKIGYVTMLGKNNKLVFQQKIKLNHGAGQGDFFVPADIPTGHYKLIGHTRWMQNQGQSSFFVDDLIIINPYQALPEAQASPSTGIISLSKADSLAETDLSKETSDFRILLPKSTYGKRQRVRFTIEQLDRNIVGVLSISVRKKGTITVPFQKTRAQSFKSSKDTGFLKTNAIVSLPELRGELISGRIMNTEDSTLVTDRDVSLSIPGNRGTVNISRSNDQGLFYFNLDRGYRSDQLILDLIGEKNEQFDIQLTPSSIVPEFVDFKNVTLSQNLNRTLEQRSIRNQIENAFFEQKADSAIGSIYIPPAYKEFQERYTLDDYTRFTTLEETIVEIIEDVVVRKRKDRYDLRIRGNNQFFIEASDQPLILIDNILVQNTSRVFQYDIKKMEQINVSRKEFYIGPKKYQGVFSIQTKSGDYTVQNNNNGPFIYKIAGPISKKTYFEQEYSKVPSKKETHTADFRQQLLWLPQHKIKATETFEFFTSDNLGTYEISVEGFTENGKPVSLLAQIQIE
ncbi:MAG: hypothetical protein Mars2KO_39470 [Maribacter sp.]